MARLSLSVLALCLFLAVFATAHPAAQNNRPDPDAWGFHMAEEMADSASPTPARLHVPASSSATPSKASPSAAPSSASSTPASPQETVSGGKSKSALDSIPFLGPLLGSLVGS